MSSSSMKTPIRRYVVLGTILLLVLGLFVRLLSDRGKQTEGQGIVVVRADEAGNVTKPGALMGLPPTATSPHVSPPSAADVQAALSSSFPALREVDAQCTGRQCEIRAVTTVPPGGAQLSAYEDMIRSGIDTMLRQRGYALSEAIQIEEVGEDEVRLQVHATM